jgi:hypothetical protein
MLNFIGVENLDRSAKQWSALDNLPIAKSKSDLAQLMTDTDRILLEMAEHAKDNAAAVFSNRAAVE